MSSWPEDELRRIAEADDLHIAPLREDGVTYGTPTWIWSVAVGGELYVRAYNGQRSRWYQAALRKAGRITAAGMTKEVAFEPVEGAINDRIDDAYRAKYHGNPYLGSMIGTRARAATVRVTPREDSPSRATPPSASGTKQWLLITTARSLSSPAPAPASVSPRHGRSPKRARPWC